MSLQLYRYEVQTLIVNGAWSRVLQILGLYFLEDVIRVPRARSSGKYISLIDICTFCMERGEISS